MATNKAKREEEKKESYKNSRKNTKNDNSRLGITILDK